jgi:protein subunit release factor B
MPLSGDKARIVAARLAALGIREEDLSETFVHAGGKGGQNVNKVATCVVLVHRPSRTTVKCQQERTQGQNRVIARELLAAKIEAARRARASVAAQEAARAQRQKRPRPRRAKAHMLANKHARSQTKSLRGRVRDSD